MTDTMDAASWRERTRQLFSSGDAVQFARVQEPIALTLVEEAKILPGERVLDIGAGSGNVAIAAARKGAVVTAVDLTPKQVELGKARTAEAGVNVTWHVADAEALPFDDGSFDVVLSNFGVVFAANPVEAARQILRVMDPAGRGLITAWPPYSYNGELHKLLSTLLPGSKGHFVDEHDWAEVEHLHGWFTPRTVRAEHLIDMSQKYASLEAWWESDENLPLSQFLKANLSPEGFDTYKARALELAKKHAEFASDGSMIRKMDYVVGHIH